MEKKFGSPPAPSPTAFTHAPLCSNPVPRDPPHASRNRPLFQPHGTAPLCPICQPRPASAIRPRDTAVPASLRRSRPGLPVPPPSRAPRTAPSVPASAPPARALAPPPSRAPRAAAVTGSPRRSLRPCLCSTRARALVSVAEKLVGSLRDRRNLVLIFQLSFL
jgi:hypothetical protein